MGDLTGEASTLKQLATEGRREWAITEPWFYLLLILILLDILLGLMFAFRRQDISSGAFWDGLKKKTSMLLVVAALVAMDPFVAGITLSILATSAYVLMEALSIVETAGKLGAPVPEAVLRVLRAMKPPEEQAQKVSIVGASVTLDTNVTNTPVPVETVPTETPTETTP